MRFSKTVAFSIIVLDPLSAPLTALFWQSAYIVTIAKSLKSLQGLLKLNKLVLLLRIARTFVSHSYLIDPPCNIFLWIYALVQKLFFS